MLKNKLHNFIIGVLDRCSLFMMDQKKISPNTAVTLIQNSIVNKKPFFAGRLGWLESYCINERISQNEIPINAFNKLRTNAGVFPVNPETYEFFYKSYLKALDNVDLLALMRTPAEANILKHNITKCFFTDLSILEPYLSIKPWSSVLKSLKVLVVHPFSESIESQYYKCRSELFTDPNVLPDFILRTLVPPQTIGNSTAGYSCWKDALDALCAQVYTIDFDVAIIGCGAYGFPLGSFVKSMGKVAIHMGGATQLLFGVSGKRWRENPTFQHLIKGSWRPPHESERPPGWETVEDGCYW